MRGCGGGFLGCLGGFRPPSFLDSAGWLRFLGRPREAPLLSSSEGLSSNVRSRSRSNDTVSRALALDATNPCGILGTPHGPLRDVPSEHRAGSKPCGPRTKQGAGGWGWGWGRPLARTQRPGGEEGKPALTSPPPRPPLPPTPHQLPLLAMQKTAKAAHVRPAKRFVLFRK